MKKFSNLFTTIKPLIGMIHLDPLPGTPGYRGNVNKIMKKALLELDNYLKAGIDSIIIENMHDVPYLKRKVGEEVTTLMSIIGYEINKRTDLPVGIQILAGANKQALAAANSAGLDFIRAEGFVFAHTADEGIIESDAGKLLRYRKLIDAENILIFTDIKKKHSSHTITNDISIVDTAKAAEFFLSDGLIITGSSTGSEADTEELVSVKSNSSLPVLVGSGITEKNIDLYFKKADGFIVGSYFKEKGNWKNNIDHERVKNLIDKIKYLRSNA